MSFCLLEDYWDRETVGGHGNSLQKTYSFTGFLCIAPSFIVMVGSKDGFPYIETYKKYILSII